jgi:hypothetical protein
MRFLVALVCCSSLSGCSLLGYHLHRSAERAPTEEAVKVTFPDSYESGARINGPLMAAIGVAMDDFLPPGAKVKLTDRYKPLEQCLSNRSTYDVVALRSDEGIFFVNIFPVMARCELDETLVDAGAVYAIDEKGRILDMR